jgi:hypothetical protein
MQRNLYLKEGKGKEFYVSPRVPATDAAGRSTNAAVHTLKPFFLLTACYIKLSVSWKGPAQCGGRGTRD